MTPSRPVRRADGRDLPRLQEFFRKAYGERTIFQDGQFLTWFFGSPVPGRDPREGLLNSFIACDDEGNVIAHYGFISCSCTYRGKKFAHNWGVNAFTLPEHRRGGIGKALVEAVAAEPANFGVIGFTEQTADFYSSIGFNVFSKKRFHRQVLLLRQEFREILKAIGTHEESSARDIEPVVDEGWLNGTAPFSEDSADDGITDFLCAAASPLFEVYTAERSSAWLRWRIAASSRLPYRIAFERGPEGQAGIIFRSVDLEPTPHFITRIVDIFGDLAPAERLMRRLCANARRQGHLYIDYGGFGHVYTEIFRRLRFVAFPEESYATFPSLTQPLGHRPNREYVGLYSALAPDVVKSLSPESVHFTLADSDRDRRGSL